MNPYYSLMAWIEKHQAYTNENGEYVWVYNRGNATYKVTCNNMGSRYIVEYNGEEEFLNFCFYNDADFVDSYYHLGEIPGGLYYQKKQLQYHRFHYSTATQLNMETLSTVSVTD